jgi:tetratricopeptide (TPR) repeat protein
MANMSQKGVYVLQFVGLSVLVVLLFSGNFQHDYHLDSHYYIVSNSFIQSLENIPLFFKDPETLSSLGAQLTDYRPILSTSYAINYAISGQDIWSYHLLQIILHIVCVIALFLFVKKIMIEFIRPENSRLLLVIPFMTGLLFAIHPMTSGVVNYLSARSSLLTAAFILPSINVYMNATLDRYRKIPWIALLLFTMALFTKVEAIAALAVYFLYDTLQTHKQSQKTESRQINGFIKDVFETFNLNTLKRLAPFIIVTFLYFVIRLHVLKDVSHQIRYDANMTPVIYFFTQLTAWWHYVFSWFAPVNLIADNCNYPIFKSISEPQVLLAIAGWVMVAFFLRVHYKKHPYLMFCALGGLALISPTSSIVPLAEMVNELRPYLPVAVVSTAWIIPGLRFACSKRPIEKYVFFFGLTLYLIALVLLTHQRNNVFQTEKAYYQDIIKKSPSARAYVNYGLTFSANQPDSALYYYQKALEKDPNWVITHINLATVYDSQGDSAKALYHYNRAVDNGQYPAMALAYRGGFYLDHKHYAQAVADLTIAANKSVEKYSIYLKIAKAYAGMGQWRNCLNYTQKCYELDHQDTEYQITDISQPFWERRDNYENGIHYYQNLLNVYPERWWIYQNIGNLARLLGKEELAEQSSNMATRLKTD